MTTLPIVWQRLVDAHGQTCDRCKGTRLEVERAISALEQALPHLGIEPELEFRELDQETFAQNPGASNRLWISGRPLEEWLDADVGGSTCPTCGGAACRTGDVDGTTFETIPEWMILKAALLASAELVEV